MYSNQSKSIILPILIYNTVFCEPEEIYLSVRGFNLLNTSRMTRITFRHHIHLCMTPLKTRKQCCDLAATFWTVSRNDRKWQFGRSKSSCVTIITIPGHECKASGDSGLTNGMQPASGLPNFINGLSQREEAMT